MAAKTKTMNKFFLPLLILIIVSCKSEITYFEDEDGIWIEDLKNLEVDSTINMYNLDNRIFKPNIEYIYDYYQIRNGEKVKFSAGGWEYVDYENPDNSTIMRYGIQTMVKNGFLNIPDDYNQSVIQFNMYDINGEKTFGRTQTGVIENKKNIWIHPLRHQNFKILELNPFPFIKTPYEIGNKYEWNLKIGDHWADPNWKVWSGVIENRMSYEIVNKTVLETELGIKNVFVIKANGVSELGETQLTSYFNQDIGFVRHEYVNIDSTELIIDIKEIRQVE